MKLFELSLRIFSAGASLPIQPGISPWNLLFPISTVASCWHPRTTAGNSPVKLLPARWSDSREQLWVDGASGILPEKELFERSMNCRACISHQQSGSSPVNWLLNRSSICRDNSPAEGRTGPVGEGVTVLLHGEAVAVEAPCRCHFARESVINVEVVVVVEVHAHRQRQVG